MPLREIFAFLTRAPRVLTAAVQHKLLAISILVLNNFETDNPTKCRLVSEKHVTYRVRVTGHTTPAEIMMYSNHITIHRLKNNAMIKVCDKHVARSMKLINVR
jgi:hypothetical protein